MEQPTILSEEEKKEFEKRIQEMPEREEKETINFLFGQVKFVSENQEMILSLLSDKNLVFTCRSFLPIAKPHWLDSHLPEATNLA